MDIRKLIIEGIQERKGHNITVVDMSAIDSAAASAFIIAEGNSNTHVSAVADSTVEYVLDKAGIKPYGIDGDDSSDWIIIDYGDVWVHIFLPETRRRYNLEELWSDATITQVPDLD